MMKKILVFGGAGYVGSHFLSAAKAAGYDLLVGDNLSTGHRILCQNIPLQHCDITNAEATDKLVAAFQPDYIAHFAGLSLVSQAQANPLLYYRVNVGGATNIIEAAMRHKVSGVIFSSSAAIYGTQDNRPIDETASALPLNAYGQSKLMVEAMLKDAYHAYGLNSIALRYFNAAGAHHDLNIGEMHAEETHLIPNIFIAYQAGQAVQIFGDDFPTNDGTCMRDYIHVSDLADGHLQGIDYLQKNSGAFAMNLGSGCGYSVRDVLKSCARSCGAEIPHIIAPRRAGDPAYLVADITKAQTALGFAPKYSIDDITQSAFHWHSGTRYKEFYKNLSH